jgi:hypothetical protein
MVKKSVIITLLALLLIGCSTERQCARAAKKCAHLWHSDTAYVHDSITIERTLTDTLLRWQTLRERDTVTIRDGRAIVRIVRLPGDSIWVQGECPDTVIRYVRQMVTKNVQQVVTNNVQQRKWHDSAWVNNTAIGYAIGFVFGFLLMLWSTRRKN